MDSFVTCWDRADAEQLSMLWKADGDIIVPDGSLIRGRHQIENFYAGVFAGGYGASTAIADVLGRWLIVAVREMEPLLD